MGLDHGHARVRANSDEVQARVLKGHLGAVHGFLLARPAPGREVLDDGVPSRGARQSQGVVVLVRALRDVHVGRAVFDDLPPLQPGVVDHPPLLLPPLRTKPSPHGVGVGAPDPASLLPLQLVGQRTVRGDLAENILPSGRHRRRRRGRVEQSRDLPHVARVASALRGGPGYDPPRAVVATDRRTRPLGARARHHDRTNSYGLSCCPGGWWWWCLF
mmetsp:Transcript_10936/g.33403  ORF Transcript_10936/g.33403 Transcript_10936/m.33403 type:complete len:216 (+) Transcript_10936:400-1047(+)